MILYFSQKTNFNFQTIKQNFQIHNHQNDKKKKLSFQSILNHNSINYYYLLHILVCWQLSTWKLQLVECLGVKHFPFRLFVAIRVHIWVLLQSKHVEYQSYFPKLKLEFWKALHLRGYHPILSLPLGDVLCLHNRRGK